MADSDKTNIDVRAFKSEQNAVNKENVSLTISTIDPLNEQPPVSDPIPQEDNSPPHQDTPEENDNGEDNDNNKLVSIYGNYRQSKLSTTWFEQVEYIIFHNELKSCLRNNKTVLRECKENKRLLDLKYDDLNNLVNNVQTSVIFVSTLSGFLQATRIQFAIPDTITSILSITISTYISLILSISKYYKLDELKERIQALREKYSDLHNRLDYRMDVLGPWSAKSLWIHQDPKKRLLEWAKVMQDLTHEYDEIIETKQGLVTEFENIMDTKSRNQYHIKNRELNYTNRQKLYEWDVKESKLEQTIGGAARRPSSIVLQHEELDNWDTGSMD
jgi:hypothetical protein